VDDHSLNGHYNQEEWRKLLRVGDVIKARIIFVDYGLKNIRLSMQPHVVAFELSPYLPPLGQQHS
jgi:transcriptional accessory protein Tex/SPT6